MYEAEIGTTSIAVAGDTLPTRRLSMFREPGYLRLRQILHEADVRFANFESTVHAYLEDAHAQHDGGGTYMTTEPPVLDDLVWLGINMLACGSSHADDYGWPGILDTIRHMDAAGIAHAGSGRHLAEARAPGYLDTPRGRFGLVAATSQFNAGARAGEQRFDTAGHPGVNAVRHRVEYELPESLLEDLRRVGQAIGLEAAEKRRQYQGEGVAPADGAYPFLGTTFRPGGTPALRTFANKRDLEENVRQVGVARSMSDRVIASLHNHEQGGPSFLTATRRSEVTDPADFAIDFAHRCIDAGADVFVGHGPQVPLAVEIYKGRPVFHGLGTFIFQLETVEFLPSEAYERYHLDDRATPADFLGTRYADDSRGHTADPRQWEQFFAVCDFAEQELKEVRLYPLELGFRTPRSQRGRPLLAEGETAERIISRVAELSRCYGTHVEFRDGIGVIRQ